MFRGKESSNRIKISCLVQDFLNFGVLERGQVGGGCLEASVGMWGVPTYMHTHCACTHTCIHI